MAIDDFCCDSSCDRLGIIDTTTKESINIGIVNLPLNITVNLLLTSACSFYKVTATDVAFCIICFYGGIRVIGSR